MSLIVAKQSSNDTYYRTAAYLQAGNSGANQTRTTNDTSAVFEGAILTELGMYVSSDERIKKNMIDISDDSALQKIKQITTKSYEYVDTVSRGNTTVYGFSAQQIQTVLPNAVSLHQEYIPNLMCTAVVEGTTLVLQENDKNVSLNYTDASNTRFTSVMAFGTRSNETLYLKIVNVDVSTNTLTLEDDIEPEYTNMDASGNNIIYLYGQSVSDFHKLDKSAIFTLSVSAIQELDRRQETQTSTINQLEQRIQQLEQLVSQISS